MFTIYMFTSLSVSAKMRTLHQEVIPLKSFRKRLSLFFYKNWNKGIPNLMLYISVANVAVFVLDMIDPSHLAVELLRFDPAKILNGQVWRLFTVSFLHIVGTGNTLLAVLFISSYVWIGRYAEQAWGPFKFNIYYFAGLLVTDLAALLGGTSFYPNDFHMTLFLILAVTAPMAQIRLWGIIPLKAKYLAWIDIGLTLFNVLQSISIYRLYLSSPGMLLTILLPLVPILFFMLFVGSDLKHLLPDAMNRTQTQKNFRSYQNQQRAKERQYGSANWADSYRSSSGEKPYRHKCTVCGRTDVTNPELEFRYCSRCAGYHCYCMEHISNHAHIQN